MTEHFELLSQLGKGGMGVVWKARDRETGHIVALKLIHSIYADDPEYVARFEREVEVARRIESPNVVKVLGYGRQGGIPYMAMEYVNGSSLREIIRDEGPVPWRELKPLLRQAILALDAAHRAGVIHRDVKPSNILVTAGGTVKLVDFGVARALDFTALTQGAAIGTPAYMAPDINADERSDLYSLGCVLYEALTGAPPFMGSTFTEVAMRHVREEPHLEALPVRASVRELLGRLLAKQPAERPRNAREILDWLAEGVELSGQRAGETARWEYVSVKHSNPVERGFLDAVGLDGWELVTFTELRRTPSVTPGFLYVLRRPAHRITPRRGAE